MDEEIERLVVRVRTDTGAFAKDVAEMRGSLDGPFADGVDRAGRRIETSLARAIATGKLGFDDLRKVALQVLSEIATAAVRNGIDAVLQGGSRNGGGAGGLLTSLLGLPGRATGGPVSPGAAYLVGERGPELFVPTTSGRVAAPAAAAGPREVRVAITVNARGGEAPAALQQSSRQVARSVRQALMDVD